MSYHRAPMGDTAPTVYAPLASKIVKANTQAKLAQQAAPGGGFPLGTVAIVGAVGIGGLLLYRRWKKKRGSSPSTDAHSTP